MLQGALCAGTLQSYASIGQCVGVLCVQWQGATAFRLAVL